jgi:SHS2 domain-containing protein
MSALLLSKVLAHQAANDLGDETDPGWQPWFELQAIGFAAGDVKLEMERATERLANEVSRLLEEALARIGEASRVSRENAQTDAAAITAATVAMVEKIATASRLADERSELRREQAEDAASKLVELSVKELLAPLDLMEASFAKAYEKKVIAIGASAETAREKLEASAATFQDKLDKAAGSLTANVDAKAKTLATEFDDLTKAVGRVIWSYDFRFARTLIVAVALIAFGAYLGSLAYSQPPVSASTSPSASAAVATPGTPTPDPCSSLWGLINQPIGGGGCHPRSAGQFNAN